ncbi:MAG: hypothetical protein HUU38_06075 [Anaerolineales bacterium]|nr:hypothetical protein [Anaerolineales bacterium]
MILELLPAGYADHQVVDNCNGALNLEQALILRQIGRKKIYPERFRQSDRPLLGLAIKGNVHLFPLRRLVCKIIRHQAFHFIPIDYLGQPWQEVL